MRTAAALAGPVALVGCVSDRSVLSPGSPSAGRISGLGWTLIVAATVVSVGVTALLVYGLVRNRGEGASRRLSWNDNRWLLGGGILLPVVVITPIAVLSIGVLDTEAAREHDAALEIEVVGHQYWWEYRYREQGFETANELHIPAGEPVRLVLRSDDVVHSFWIPRLGGKTDLVPGRTNTMLLEADEPGVYAGQCAEYCGLQHAKMRVEVVAESRSDFDAWVEQQRAPADPPTSASATEGAGLFEAQGCASCHTVRGTDADGRLGPDLTHFASRRTLAAGVLDNTHENRIRWIADTWEVKDGAFMPEVPLGDGEVEAIVAYLETLE